MKFKVKGLVFVGFAAAILSANAALAASDNTVTSKSYVDTHFQQKSTAASIGNSEGNWTPLDASIPASGGESSAPTSAAVRNALANATQVTNFVSSTITDGVTTKAPSEDAVHDALALKEDSNNKVTSMSSESTNAQYPSAKAVYDALNGAEHSNFQTYSDTANRVSDGNGGWKALGTTLDTTDTDNYDANNAVTAGTIAAALDANKQATTYTPGTNVQIVNNEISATDTTYTAGSNITITGDNNAIAATTGAVADAVTTLVTGDTVYDYVQSQTGGNVIPPMPNTCTATAPCALVTVNGAPSWQPIAQAEASVGTGA